MPSRDYLIRQIEEMAIFLGILLRRILKLKEENQPEQMEAVVKEALIQEMKLDIDQAIVLENQDFLNLVKAYFNSDDQLEKLADILKVLGENIGQSFTPTKVNYLQKSLFIFLYLQESSSVFSYERRIKIQQVQEVLLHHNLPD